MLAPVLLLQRCLIDERASATWPNNYGVWQACLSSALFCACNIRQDFQIASFCPACADSGRVGCVGIEVAAGPSGDSCQQHYMYEVLRMLVHVIGMAIPYVLAARIFHIIGERRFVCNSLDGAEDCLKAKWAVTDFRLCTSQRNWHFQHHHVVAMCFMNIAGHIMGHLPGHLLWWQLGYTCRGHFSSNIALKERLRLDRPYGQVDRVALKAKLQSSRVEVGGTIPITNSSRKIWATHCSSAVFLGLQHANMIIPC
eukprot:796243-Amphidinium_carterae.1